MITLKILVHSILIYLFIKWRENIINIPVYPNLLICDKNNYHSFLYKKAANRKTDWPG